MEMFEKYKKQIIIMLVAIGIPALIIFINLLNKKDVENVKSENGSNLPQVNLSSNNAEALNEHLKNLYEQYTSDGKSKFNYKYETYNDIVSILVEIDKYDERLDSYIKEYMSFNINKDGSYLANEDISELFGYDILEIKEKVDKRLREYYNEEVKLGYLNSQTCSYECYLNEKNIIYVMDIVSLVIEDKKLVIYLNLNVDETSEYFNNLNYNPYKITIE